MNNSRYQLEPYKSPANRYRCPNPACLRPHEFTRYIDVETGLHLADDVGKCNREDKCGYHKTPREYFRENPKTGPEFRGMIVAKPFYQTPRGPTDYLPGHLVEATHRQFQRNNLFQFFTKQIGEKNAKKLFDTYKAGTAKHWPGATAFWQIDELNRARQCKVMQYNPDTGKRVKGQNSFIAFMGKRVLNKPDANLQQCLFGTHILPRRPLAPVAIVESEKTAMYCAYYFPDFVWLATGGKQGCKWTDRAVLAPLMDRTIILFPDLKATADWKIKADKIGAIIRCKIVVSDYLENMATEQQRADGLDIMDFHMMEPERYARA